MFAGFFRVVVVLVFVMVVSCVGEIGEGDEVVAADRVWDNFRQYTVSGDRRVETLADRALVFTDDDKTLMRRVRLNQYGADGELEFRGVADEVEAQGNGDGFARENVVVEDVVDGVILEAEYLKWNSDERLLTGDGRVFVDLGDGLKVSGEDFEADVARRSYRFGSDVEGTLVVKEEGDEEAMVGKEAVVAGEDVVVTDGSGEAVSDGIEAGDGSVSREEQVLPGVGEDSFAK